MSPTAAAFLSVGIVSLISLVGAVGLWVSAAQIRRILLPLVALAAGAMLGDAFLHLLPHAVDEAHGFTRGISLAVLAGVVAFLLLEKVIHWQHSHDPCDEDHVHPVAKMNLVGDAVHNLLDGILVAGAYLEGGTAVGIPVTIAVALHEIPQEIGDFAILLHGGFKPGKALLLNLLSGCVALVGAALVLLIGHEAEHFGAALMPFTAGAFLYIAASDLIPELRKETRPAKSFVLLVSFAAGIALMALIETGGHGGHAH